MYGLSLGVQRMSEILPAPVYALLSGLNSSTVGIIALAAVQLAEKAIKDKLTRILVIMGAVAGLCYNALWYFPTLMAIGGVTVVIWDGWLHQEIRKLRLRLKRRQSQHQESGLEDERDSAIILEENGQAASTTTLQRRLNASRTQDSSLTAGDSAQVTRPRHDALQTNTDHVIRIRVGVGLVITFFGRSTERSGSRTLMEANLSSIIHCRDGASWCPRPKTSCLQPLRKHVSGRDDHLRWRTCRHSTTALVCGRTWLGFQSRLSPWACYHPSFPWAELQFRRLSGRSCTPTL